MPRDALVAALCVPIDPLIVLDAAPLPGRAEVEAWPPVRLEVQPACVGLNACPSLSMPEIEEECATLVIGLGSGSVLGLGLGLERTSRGTLLTLMVGTSAATAGSAHARSSTSASAWLGW